MTTTEPETTLTFNENVLAKITGKTADTVDGVLTLEGNFIDKMTDKLSNADDPTQGVDVDIDQDEHQVKLHLEAILEYGKNAQTVFDKLVSKVTAAINDMTNMHVEEIKLNVKDMLTREEWAEQNKKQTKKPEPPKDHSESTAPNPA